MFQGALSGASQGGELGTSLGAIAGPKGAIVGKAAGMLIGGISGAMDAGKQSDKLEKARNIQAEDPEQRRDLELGRQRLKALQTGSAADTQAEMQGVGQNVKAGLSAYAKVGGPGTLAGMTQMLKAGQQGINQAQIGGQQQSLYQQQFVRSLGDLMAQRRLETKMLRRDDAEFDTAEQQNVAGANAMALLGSGGIEDTVKGLGSLFSKGQSTTPSTTPSTNQGGAIPGVPYKNELTGVGNFSQSTNFGGKK
jgi:hypothetical protein